jgi:hypothetical protein
MVGGGGAAAVREAVRGQKPQAKYVTYCSIYSIIFHIRFVCGLWCNAKEKLSSLLCIVAFVRGLQYLTPSPPLVLSKVFGCRKIGTGEKPFAIRKQVTQICSFGTE